MNFEHSRDIHATYHSYYNNYQITNVHNRVDHSFNRAVTNSHNRRGGFCAIVLVVLIIAILVALLFVCGVTMELLR